VSGGGDAAAIDVPTRSRNGPGGVESDKPIRENDLVNVSNDLGPVS